MMSKDITPEEFLSMTFDDRARPELIYGQIYNMSPTSPVWKHQKTLRFIGAIFDKYFRGRKCEPMQGPLDVYLGDNYVIPDMIVLCDMSKIYEDGKCHGAPDLVVEVLSKSTAYVDKTIKMDLYRRFGVKEYWIVNTLRDGMAQAEVFSFDQSEEEDRYRLYVAGETAESKEFAGLNINLKELVEFLK
jgi:Uma2 family endonuclease